MRLWVFLVVMDVDLVRQRASLKRRFTRLHKRLQKELAKEEPSAHYLHADWVQADALVTEIDAVQAKVRLHAENVQDDERLEAMDLWDESFDEEASLFRDVRSHIEHTAFYLLSTQTKFNNASSQVDIPPVQGNTPVKGVTQVRPPDRLFTSPAAATPGVVSGSALQTSTPLASTIRKSPVSVTLDSSESESESDWSSTSTAASEASGQCVRFPAPANVTLSARCIATSLSKVHSYHSQQGT